MSSHASRALFPPDFRGKRESCNSRRIYKLLATTGKLREILAFGTGHASNAPQKSAASWAWFCSQFNHPAILHKTCSLSESIHCRFLSSQDLVNLLLPCIMPYPRATLISQPHFSYCIFLCSKPDIVLAHVSPQPPHSSFFSASSYPYIAAAQASVAFLSDFSPSPLSLP